MYDSWTSLAIAPRERRAFWSDISARAFVPMTPQLSRVDDFQAVMTHRTIDGLVLNEVRGPSHGMWRTKGDVSRGGSPVLFLNLYQSGRARVDQNGQEVVSAPGALLLFDSCHPFRLEQPDQTDLLSLAVPYSVLTGCGTFAFEGNPQRLPETASAMLLVNQMRALAQWQRDLAASDASSIAEALTGLVRAALTTNKDVSPGPVQRRRMRGKVATLIERHYADSNYTPAAAAREMGVSVRTLHAWLAHDGTSFGTELWAHRLERAQVMLQTLRPLAVHEVAMRCGFASAAHLSRRFRKHFGVSPSASRDPGP